MIPTWLNVCHNSRDSVRLNRSGIKCDVLKTPKDIIAVSVRGAVSKPPDCIKGVALTVSLRNIKPCCSYYAKVICKQTHATLYSVSDRAE